MRSILLSALLIAASSAARPALAEHSDGIHVTGIGEVVTVPDMAHVTLAITQRSQDANVAKQEVDRITAKLLALTKRLDIEERDVTAALMRLNPIYSRNSRSSPVIDAIEASRIVSIRVKDLDSIGDLVNGAVELGINGIQGIQLDSMQRVQLERQALDHAIADAKREAARVAENFGVQLGALIDARTQAHTAQPMPGVARANMELAASAMPFTPGEMIIRRDVQATFSIATE